MNGTDKAPFLSRMKESIRDCSCEIVFGMPGGTVPIFGLVGGMVAGVRPGNVVFGLRIGWSTVRERCSPVFPVRW